MPAWKARPCAPPPAAAAAPAVNLGKVTLSKQGEQRSVSLRKGEASRPIHVNLNWQAAGGKRRGFLSGRSSAPDLDLGCMFELADGRKSVIQPLGGNFGSPNGPPWIHLDKDDRSGGAADGENLFLVKPEHLSRVMIFAMIYEGAPDFQTVGAYMSILDQDGQLTQIVLDNPDANRTFCSVALITTKGDQVVIQKEERYFRHAEEADNYYAFGFNWRAGSKD
jgi:tellurite resistance protein TerA